MGGAASFVGGLVGGKNSLLNTVTGRSAMYAQQDAAQYAAQSAQAQEAEARRVRDQIQQWGTQGLSSAMGYAAPSVNELRAMEQQLGTAEKQLANDQRLLDAVDPALMEASKQALSLLRGDKAQSLGPLEQQRAEQRNQLVQRLREQYGPGAESTSAGAKALRQFDSETSTITNNAQQQSLGMLLGTAQSSRPNLSNNVAAFGSVANQYGNVANRQTQANLSAYGNLMSAYGGASQAAINSSGSQFTQGVLNAQAQAQYSQNLANQLMNVGGMALGGIMGGGE